MFEYSIIIPHYNGELILNNCLESIFQAIGNYEVIVVDNGSSDQSVSRAKDNFSQIKIVQPGKNLGYAGGCSFGSQHATGEWLIYLNNDTEVEPSFFKELTKTIAEYPQASIFQPKILSLQSRDKLHPLFDYAGGAGGRMDCLGYPFAYGRVMAKVEQDLNQYNKVRSLVWASGTACVIKKSVADKLGYFDDLYFAHMEEIDLCLRAIAIGGEVYSSPTVIVWHLGGQTLAMGHPEKKYFNHRNNWYLMLKIMPIWYFLLIFPFRLVLDILGMINYGFQDGVSGIKAVLRAWRWLFRHRKVMLTKKQEWLTLRTTVNPNYRFQSIFSKLSLIPVVLRLVLK